MLHMQNKDILNTKSVALIGLAELPISSILDRIEILLNGRMGHIVTCIYHQEGRSPWCVVLWIVGL